MMPDENWKDFLSDVIELVGETLEKGGNNQKKDAPVRDTPQSFFVNPYDYTSTAAGMWRERRTAISWDTLRTIAEKNPVVSAIIGTRVNQISAFSSPARLQDAVGNDTLGYKIIHKDKNKKLTKTEEEFITDLENFIQFSGLPDTYNIYDRDNFDSWLRKITRDSLTFDAAVSELIPTRRGLISEYHAVDAATIRLAIAKQDINSASERAFVQIMNGQVVTEFEAREIMYGIRNPTTAVQNNGYGVSEIEQLVSTVTNIFNAMSHNAMFFRNGAATKGLINIKPPAKGSGAPSNQIEAFKRAWHAMTAGTQNAWKTPILQSDNVEFVNMGSTNREMEFSNYLDFLVKLTCAIYSIDPGEINFYMQASGQGGGAMFESNQEARLKVSRDKGLRPLLSAISRWINQFIIQPLASDYYFSFVGIDSKDEKEIIDLRKTEVGAYKTVDEVRGEAGLDPLGADKGGDLILNPQFMQFMQQKAMEAMQESTEEEAGEEEAGESSEEESGGDEDTGESASLSPLDHLTSDQNGPKQDGNDNPLPRTQNVEKSLRKALHDDLNRKYIRITIDD